jgi:hypothetical protein
MDFITGLLPYKSKDVIFVLVNHLTKYDHSIPLTNKFTTSKIVDLFIKHVSMLHGFCWRAISDKNPKVVSHLWKELFKLAAVTFNISTSY